jgi:hypothetical protein
VRIATWGGRRYILSMLGESQWARNLRVAGMAQLIVGTAVEPVTATEVHADDKAAFLTWYCRHPAYRLRARYGLRADTAHLTPAEIDRLARQYPVFRLESVATGEGDQSVRHASAGASVPVSSTRPATASRICG